MPRFRWGIMSRTDSRERSRIGAAVSLRDSPRENGPSHGCSVNDGPLGERTASIEQGNTEKWKSR
jgi:hypothetical protein